jgi:FKBP-type peptidyl-prolyl cis-trans isomerase SlpA
MSKIENGNTVKVHYTGTFENGEVFDSSVERNEPISFTVGSKQVIPGFENALMGMAIGESKKVTLVPEQAYGNVINEMIQEVDKTLVPPTVKVGEVLTSQTEQGPFNVVVREVNENTVLLDGNHPMAGKTLVFELEVVEIV